MMKRKVQLAFRSDSPRPSGGGKGDPLTKLGGQPRERLVLSSFGANLRFLKLNDSLHGSPEGELAKQGRVMDTRFLPKWPTPRSSSQRGRA